MERLIHSHFVEHWKDEKQPTYALEFKARNNTQLAKQDVLTVIDERVSLYYFCALKFLLKFSNFIYDLF